MLWHHSYPNLDIDPGVLGDEVVEGNQLVQPVNDAVYVLKTIEYLKIGEHKYPR